MILEYIEFEYEDYLPRGTLTEYYESDAGFISDPDVIETLEYTRKGTRITDVLSHQIDGTRKLSQRKEYKSGKTETEIYEYFEDELISYSKTIQNADSSLNAVSIAIGTENTFITVTSVKADGTTVIKKYEAGA